MQRYSTNPQILHSSPIPELKLWRELAILAQIVMELCWIVPWYRSLTIGTNLAEPWRVFIVFGVVLILISILARILNYLSLIASIQRFVLFFVIGILTLLSLRYLLYFSRQITLGELIQLPVQAFADLLVIVPDEFVIILFMIFLSFRAISIASQKVSPGDMLHRFQFGIAMMIIFVFVNTLVTGEIPGDFLYLLIFAGLLSISSARMYVVGRLRGGRDITFDRKWFWGITGSALTVVGISYLASLVTGAPAFGWVLRIFSFLISILIGLLLLIFVPIFILLFRLVQWIMQETQLQNTFPELLESLDSVINNLSTFASQILNFLDPYLPDLALSKPIILWLIVAIVLIAGLLWVGLRWLIANYDQLVDDDLESVLEKRGLWKNIKLSMLRQLRSLGERLDQAISGLRKNRRYNAIKIRRIYQQLLELADDLGAHRLEATTPQEFLPVLQAVFPDHIIYVHRITEAYNQVRYGEVPEIQVDISQLEEDWRILHQAGIQKIAAKKESQS
jgi:hypothetical protein